jgi:4-amino-4-deoxy-L-arabinose transferase-like glycosyltransferase
MRARGPAIAALLVVLVAGALRFEALVTRYWQAQDAPAWALRARDVVATLHPRFGFVRETNPYTGDPFAYMGHARAMRGFYDAHVREPLFVAAARLGIRLAGGRDIGLNFTSAFFGTLLVAATFLLGARTGSPWVGVAAAGLLAVERRAISLSVEGWRDDTHAALAMLAAWALLGLLRRPSRGTAWLAGGLGAAACLTRLTSLAFLAPAWAFIALWGDGERGARLRAVGLCAVATLVAVAPYMLNCLVAFGDPLYAINYHAADFSRRAGLSRGSPTDVGAFLASLQGPLERLDTLWLGLTSVPFGSKWSGFRSWSAALGPVLAVASAAGLARWTLRKDGRFLLLLYVGLVLPYAMIWRIPGGNNWRYTLPIYPLYLVAAAVAVARVAELLRLRAPGLALGEGLQVAAVGASGLLLANGLQYGSVAEDVARGRGALVEAGPRDGLFFTQGWSWPERAGNVRLRRSHGDAAVVLLPLPPGTAAAVRFRMSVRGPSGRVAVVLNGSPLAILDVESGARMGDYRVEVPAPVPGQGRSRFELAAAPGASLGLWYVRVEGAAPVLEPEAGDP